MLDLGQAVLDAVLAADAIEDMFEGMDIGLAVGELDAVIRQYRMEPVGDCCNEIAQKLRCGHLASFLDQAGECELRGSVNRDEQVKLALAGMHLGDVDVKVADGVAFELLL